MARHPPGAHFEAVVSHRAACAYDPRCPVYLFYWYKSTNTGAREGGNHGARERLLLYACPLYLLYWYKSTNTDAREAARGSDFGYMRVLFSTGYMRIYVSSY
jgi:hypothetical protein